MDMRLPEETINTIEKEQNNENKKESNKFWIPVTISIISLGVSIYAVLKPTEKQYPLIIKDTVRIFAPSNSPKSEPIKGVDKKKK
jgi:hypothetical protein